MWEKETELPFQFSQVKQVQTKRASDLCKFITNLHYRLHFQSFFFFIFFFYPWNVLPASEYPPSPVKPLTSEKASGMTY